MPKFAEKAVYSLRSTVYRLKKTINRKVKGFTLIELLVVITIIAILSGIGYVSFSNAQQKGRDAKRKKDLQNLQAALVLYYQDKGHYPPDDQTLQSTVLASDTGDDWIPGLAPYLTKVVKDPRQSGTVVTPPTPWVTKTDYFPASSIYNMSYQKNGSNPPDYYRPGCTAASNTSVQVGQSGSSLGYQ